MAFDLTKEQSDQIMAWKEAHVAERHPNPESFGAIGGGITFAFTPTSIGLIVKVRCFCGAECDVSDYENW